MFVTNEAEKSTSKELLLTKKWISNVILKELIVFAPSRTLLPNIILVDPPGLMS